MDRRKTKDNPLPSLAGKKLSGASGQAKRFVKTAMEHRNEAMAKMRKRVGKATTTIRIARPTHRAKYIDGEVVWERLVG